MLILAEGAIWLSVVSAASGLIGSAIGAGGAIYLAELKIKADRRADRFRALKQSYAECAAGAFGLGEALWSYNVGCADLRPSALYDPKEILQRMERCREELSAAKVVFERQMASVLFHEWNTGRWEDVEGRFLRYSDIGTSMRQAGVTSDFDELREQLRDARQQLHAAMEEIGASLRTEEDDDDLS